MMRVLIVDDSAFNRTTLAGCLAGCPDIQVVGTAADGYEAIRAIRRHRPHVMTLDLEMPGMDGLSLLRWVMAQHPIPVVVVTSRESNYSLFEALEMGAVDFVLKPGRESPELPQISSQLIARLRQVMAARPRLERRVSMERPSGDMETTPMPAVHSGVSLMVLAASTGGPPAIQRILAALPADFPAAVAVVQHMPAAFTAAFARRLDASCSLPVRQAGESEMLHAGEVLVAAGGSNLRLEEVVGDAFAFAVEAVPSDQENTPNADRLLESVAATAGPRAAGFVLTGMGRDGTAGLRALAAAGGMTVAESERSAVVFGMPRHAMEAGVVARVMPLEAMACLMTRMARDCPLPQRPFPPAGLLGDAAP